MTSPGNRVLIVDDFPDAAEAAEMLLTMLGYECAIANSGRAALALVVAFDPGIVLLDIGLPDLSGYEVAIALRARPIDHPLYLAAITGWGQPEDRVRALAAGFDQHVLKPADAAALKDIMARAAARFAPASG